MVINEACPDQCFQQINSSKFMPEKRIAKNTLSKFLRTKCDRELFLSLHLDSVLKTNGMPIPLQARPGIGVLKTAGRDFEDQRNQELIKAFGARVIFHATHNDPNKPAHAPAETLLSSVTQFPSIVLQAKIEPSKFQHQVLTNIGIDPTQITQFPSIDGMIPDIIIVRDCAVDDEEILPSGVRCPIDYGNEKRKALSIIDIKHTGEANPSYSAEIALYALFLSNWLAFKGLADRYFVTVRSYLWTRFKQGDSQFEDLLNRLNLHPVSVVQFMEALIGDSEEANLRFYLPTVLRFFREDLPRVIAIGDASINGWEDLEWHVDNRCSACDWLGHERWANLSDLKNIQANPNHYCYTAARACGHLSRIPGMTRGARKTLIDHKIRSTTSVANANPHHPAFQQHSHLKKERSRLRQRAQALNSATTIIDNSAVLATLAPWPQLFLCISVNFDPSAGLLTGLSVMARATGYVQGQSPKNFGNRSFIVDQKSLIAEWTALEGLLSHISDIIDQAEAYIISVGGTPLTAQIAFWEQRQFEELCSAMGRHLSRVFSLTRRKTKALAWLFPAEELIERPDGTVSPCVVFIDELVKRVVFTPTPHVITLFDTAEEYFSGTGAVRQTDAFYREFLTNGIPRERIYEIWSNQTTIERGSVSIPRNTVIQEYGNALEKQSRALSSISERLRADFRNQLRANAPKLVLSIPQGPRGVAFDSKLWVWWEELQYQTRRLEDHQRLALDGETLEATYDAIRLTNGVPTGNPLEYVFDVLPGSTEAKLDDDQAFYAFGKEGRPGFPLEKANNILPSGIPPYGGNSQKLMTPLWSSLSVELQSFDRVNRRAIVRFSSWNDAFFAPYLFTHSTIDLLNDVFVTKGLSAFKWFETVKEILSAVGNPSIAVADPNAAIAMGAAQTAPGNDPVSPLARVLWAPAGIQGTSLLSKQRASAIASYASARHGLNESQEEAVRHSAESGLTIIWGPPGTGKTKTLAGAVHALAQDSVHSGPPVKILISGPTYKAIEELMDRIVQAMDSDPSCPADIFIGYSRSKRPRPVSTANTHLSVTSFNLEQTNAETQACLASIQDPSRVTIVATVAMQACKLSRWANNSILSSIFDVVIIDESSQVPVTSAISPIATLKDGARLIIAGDRLQMPPILSLEPPVGSEYLVGSIQQYLISRFAGQLRECPLDINYRSAEDIVAYARTIGYRQSLKSHYPRTSLHPLTQIPTFGCGFPITLPWSDLWPKILDPGRKVMTLLHEDDLSSQSNLFEARIVAALAWCLRTTMSAELDGRGAVNHAPPTPDRFWNDCLGIVTPHRAQRALVVRELRSLFPSDIPELIDSAVDTVEKFQGGERHSIIVTFGVGDADVIQGEEAFLMQLERTNVAISRAMAKCIVIMPKSLAGHVPQDKKALLTAHAIKNYVDEFCGREIFADIQLGTESRRSTLRYH
jgi:hypothetical protein